MGNLIRSITSDGFISAIAVDSTDLVSKCERIHKTSAVVTAGLGRLLTAASMMGVTLKGEDNSITIRVSGDGPVGHLVAITDYKGNVRGYAGNNVVEIPLSQQGKLDVGGAVGRKGTLSVSKDLGLKEPYNGVIPLVSGEIAEDITAYYAFSEQIPTICALGVLVNPDLTVKKAGGYLIQLLPTADEQVIGQVEKGITGIPSITQMLTDGYSLMDILNKVLPAFKLELLGEMTVNYRCNCSLEKAKDLVLSLSKEDLMHIYENQDTAEIKCHFCNKEYHFEKKDLQCMEF